MCWQNLWVEAAKNLPLSWYVCVKAVKLKKPVKLQQENYEGDLKMCKGNY